MQKQNTINTIIEKNIKTKDKKNSRKQTKIKKTFIKEDNAKHIAPFKLGFLRIVSKKNNIFINITDDNGKTIIKFSSGLIQKKKSKKQLYSILKEVLSKVRIFMYNNFQLMNIIVKGDSNLALFVWRHIKKKTFRVPLQYFQNRVLTIHNGCRPPKKRRV